MSRKTLICLHTALIMGVSDVFLIPEDKSKDLVESNLVSLRKLSEEQPKKFDFLVKSMRGSTITILGSIEDAVILPLSEPVLLVDFDSLFHDIVMKVEVVS